jgi:hypothetical protein
MKDIIATSSGGTVYIKDALTEETLFSGQSSAFLNADGNSIGGDATAVQASLETTLNKVNLRIAEMQDVSVIGGAIAPDLSAYAEKTYVDQEVTSAKNELNSTISTSESTLQGNINTVSNSIATSIAPVSSALSTIETSVDTISEKVNNIPEIIAQSSSFTLSFSRPYRTRCHANSGVTFTAPANGKVSYLLENYRYSVTSMGNVIMYISEYAPPTTPITTIDEETSDPGDTSVFLDYIDTYVEPQEVPGNTGGSYVTPAVLAQSSSQETASAEFIISGLTPGQEYTLYLWLASFIFANNNTTTIQFINGVKIKEVL